MTPATRNLEHAALEVQLFGSTRASVAPGLVNLGARKQRAVFAVLALNPGSVVAIDRLESAIWGDEPPNSARNAIQVYVAGIRRALGSAGDRLQTAAVGYRLDVDPGEVDVLRFQRALDRTNVRPVTAAQLRAALAMWTDEPLADLVDFPFAPPILARLAELRLAAREDLVDAELMRGRHQELIGEIEELIADEPYRERGWRQLMLALYRSGRQADALAAFRRARDLLDEDLGLEPSPALAALERAILLQDPALDPSASARGEGAGVPALLNPTVGRVSEIEETSALVVRERLVTITGPGGAGKTRLATEVAARTAAQFQDGVWFADMSATLDRATLLADLSRILGAPSAEDPVGGVAAHLAGRHALLVVDNLEQVTDAGIDLADLLQRTNQVHVLATSRTPLRVTGERLVQIGPLEPAEAIDLFRTRAAAITRDAPSDEVAAAIAERLDGLPLAIELAAASCRVMAASEVLERLTRLLPLPSGPRNLPARHQTLRATVSWSTNLLAPDDRDLLAALSVFRAPFTIATATRLLYSDPQTALRLGALVDASLVVRDGDRYRMLGTVRDVVRESVSEERRSALEDLHAQWIAATTEAAVPGLHGPDEASVRVQIASLLPDIRAAVEHLVGSGRHQVAASILVATAPVCFHDGRFREFATHERTVSTAGELTPQTRAEVTTLRGIFAKLTGDEPGADDMLRAGIEGLRETAPASVALVNGLCHLAATCAEAGDRDEALSLADEAVAVARNSTDAGSVAMALDLTGYVARTLGDDGRALLATQEAVAQARQSHSSQLANALAGLAAALSAANRHVEAARAAWEALAISEATGSLAQQAEVATHTSAVLARADLPGSVSRLAAALATWIAFGAVPPAIDVGLELARLVAEAQPAGATRLVGALASRSPGDLPEAAGPIVDGLRVALGEPVFAHERAVGSALDDDALSRLAAELAGSAAGRGQGVEGATRGRAGS